MRKLFVLLLSAVVAAGLGTAQTLRVQHTTFHSNNDQWAFQYVREVIQTADKGFAFVATTGGQGGGPIPTCIATTPPPGFNGRFIWGKLDSTGAVQWIRHMCDTPVPATAICQTHDGGYAINGGTYPWLSMSIFRYDAQGNYLWRKDYGKGAESGTNQIISTPDKGFLLFGMARGSDSDITVNYGPQPPVTFQPLDWVVMKLDSLGNKQWVRTLGTSGDENGARVVCDGKNYYLVGSTNSNDHDCADVAGHPGLTIYAIKLDSAGNKLWTRAYGAGFVENVLFDDRDGTIMVAGRSVGGHEFAIGSGTDDYFLTKMDTAGYIKWGKLYDAGGYEYVPSVSKAPHGGYFLAGYSTGLNPPTPLRGALFSIDSAGNKLDHRTITGGAGHTWYKAIFPVASDGQIALGVSNALSLSEGTGQNTPYSNTYGSGALIVSKLAIVPLTVEVNEQRRYHFILSPNPVSGSTEFRFLGTHKEGWVVCTASDGKTMYCQRIDAQQSSLTVSTSGWSPGSYIMCWQPKNGLLQCSTLLVQ